MVSRFLTANPSGEIELSKPKIKEYSIPFQVPGSKADRELLHYYCCQTAGDLSSSLDGDFWTHLILSRGHDEPVIRNALVTLSRLHKDYIFEEVGTSSPNPGDTPVHHARNLSLVARSHRQLRNYLFRMDATLEVALICSIIFYSFESLLGEPERAIDHLNHGLMLLKQSQVQQVLGFSDDGLMKRLVRLYERLDVQASTFEDRRPPILTLVTSEERMGLCSVVPPHLSDTVQAEAVLIKLQNWALHHFITHVDLKHRPWEEYPLDVLCERRVLAMQFDRYGHVLEQYCVVSGIKSQRLGLVMQQEQTTQLLHLQTQFLLFRALLSENLPSMFWMKSLLSSDDGLTCQGTRQLLTFSSNPDDSLRQALSSLTRILSADNGTPTASNSKPMSSKDQNPFPEKQRRTFTLSGQIVPALYFTCIKTTDPDILSWARAATLAIRGRDGLWDAETVSFIIEEVAQINALSEHSDLTTIISPMSEDDTQPSGKILDSKAIDLACYCDESCAGRQGHEPQIPKRLKYEPGYRLEDAGLEILDADGGIRDVAKQLHEKLIARTEGSDPWRYHSPKLKDRGKTSEESFLNHVEIIQEPHFHPSTSAMYSTFDASRPASI
ncbi:hypothetical protein LTR84_009507 [Exophiala bonariae]|uniref:Transcription factor domain-containing protein n=1 Tax=Exophiala bonariae TaxID=1690606 RepID=A0AAV9MU50_9EURO|nr:hypothetical protein LTR84_009507 [Exophiala bonariae]